MACRRNIKIFALLMILITIFVLIYADDKGNSPQISPQQIISTNSIENTNIKISAGSNGRIFVIWQGEINDRFHIFFREKYGNSWLEPIIIDDVRDDDDYDPALFVDEDSNPHIVWVSKKDELQEIHYAHRLGSDWIFEPPIRSSKELNLEMPTIVVTSGGTPFIAWQEGKGVAYSIWSAFENAEGNFATLPVSSPLYEHYNIYPQLYLTPLSPLLLWYEANETGFSLRASVFVNDVKRWVDYPLSGMGKLPANRLPLLYATKSGRLFALWYDNINGEDRILLGQQDEETECAGLIIDDGTTQNNSLPAAASATEDVIYACWQADMAMLFSQIFFTRIIGGVAEKSILLSDGARNYYSNPEMAVDKNGHLHIVWFSDASEGGDGAVYYTTITY